jgi:hypothetical protein
LPPFEQGQFKKVQGKMDLWPSDKVCKRFDAFGATCFDGVRIERPTSDDFPDGRPTLSLEDGESFLVLVAHLPDQTIGDRSRFFKKTTRSGRRRRSACT